MLLNAAARSAKKLAGKSNARETLGVCRMFSSSDAWRTFDPYNPTEEHKALREMVRNFSVNEVDPQRLEHDREEKFNYDLFKRCGELGLLG